MHISNGTYINFVCIDAGDDYSLNWEQRLHIALDAAQGPYFSCVFAFRPCMYVCVSFLSFEVMYVCVDKLRVLINNRP